MIPVDSLAPYAIAKSVTATAPIPFIPALLKPINKAASIPGIDKAPIILFYNVSIGTDKNKISEYLRLDHLKQLSCPMIRTRL